MKPRRRMMKWLSVLSLCVSLIQADDNVPTPSAIPLQDTCSRPISRTVIHIVQEEMMALADKNNVALSAECPVHPEKDQFAWQEQHKEKTAGTWQCQFCNKRFRNEHYLDYHISMQHKNETKEGQTTCMADYCSLLACMPLEDRKVYLQEQPMRKAQCTQLIRTCFPEPTPLPVTHNTSATLPLPTKSAKFTGVRGPDVRTQNYNKEPFSPIIMQTELNFRHHADKSDLSNPHVLKSMQRAAKYVQDTLIEDFCNREAYIVHSEREWRTWLRQIGQIAVIVISALFAVFGALFAIIKCIDEEAEEEDNIISRVVNGDDTRLFRLSNELSRPKDLHYQRLRKYRSDSSSPDDSNDIPVKYRKASTRRRKQK